MAHRHADLADLAPGEVYPVADLDLASRLSFFLWSSAPDDALLAAAEQGQLSDPAELARRCDRASERLFAAGAHYVIESVAELPSVLDDIEAGITA